MSATATFAKKHAKQWKELEETIEVLERNHRMKGLRQQDSEHDTLFETEEHRLRMMQSFQHALANVTSVQKLTEWKRDFSQMLADIDRILNNLRKTETFTLAQRFQALMTPSQPSPKRGGAKPRRLKLKPLPA